MLTDPIADMLTRIRNAVRVAHTHVDLPTSKLKCGIADAMKREGFIWDWEKIDSKPNDTLRLHLKYGPDGECVVQHIKRVSKPGCRVYGGAGSLKKAVLNGLGVRILSTNRGILSDREAKEKNLGGEILCEIW